MKTIAPALNNDRQFIEVKISKLEEALRHIRTKIQLHSSYSNIRHLIDKEKELTDMLEETQKQYSVNVKTILLT